MLLCMHQCTSLVLASTLGVCMKSYNPDTNNVKLTLPVVSDLTGVFAQSVNSSLVASQFATINALAEGQVEASSVTFVAYTTIVMPGAAIDTEVSSPYCLTSLPYHSPAVIICFACLPLSSLQASRHLVLRAWCISA